MEKVLKQAHLHWAPTMYRGASLYCRSDSQLPTYLQQNPQYDSVPFLTTPFHT